MADSRASDIMKLHGQMESDRSTFDAHWREVAELVLPRHNDFQQASNRVEGEKRTEKIFDSTAVMALDRAASAIDSLITPSTQMYHRLDPEDDRLSENLDVKKYLDEINKMLFRTRYRPAANFSSQAHECYVGLMAFGTDCLFVDEYLGVGIRYRAIPMVELFIAENHNGVVDYVHRKLSLTARAAHQKWGDKLPEKIIKCADKEPFRKFEFIHCVKPNDDINPRRKDYRGMQMSSYHVSIEGQQILSEGGYRTMPYAVGRHVTSPRETYGRSPAMQVLPDIKMLNEMEKTIIRAAHKIVSPPLLLFGDGVLTAFSTRPDSLNYGGVDERGNQLVHPMKMGSNLPIAFDMTEQKRKSINDAFYVTLFQILVENPRMTATEALIRAQEKGQLLAPTVGRQQSEWMGAIIERELDIHNASGLIPTPPRELLASGGGVKVTHTSPLSRLRRAEDGVAIMRTIESLIPMANINPEVMDIFDDTETARELADINGVPAKVLRSKEVVDQIRAKRQEDRQTAADAQNADLAANAARNAMKAAETAGMVPGV
jgi:hypothetical protein